MAEQVTGAPVNVINDMGKYFDIHHYCKITYVDIYPGIDLEFEARRGTEKPVEYNFIVHPGADASRIKLKYNSDAAISLKNGEISMKLAFGTLIEKIPASYTRGDGHSLAIQYKPLNESDNLYGGEVAGP